MTDTTTPVSLADLIAGGEVQTAPRMLDQKGKEELAEAGTPFTINSMSYGDDGEFKPYYQFDITLNDRPAVFRLSTNEHRDEMLQSLATVTARQPVSGVRLRAIGTRGGNKFLTIEAV